MKQILFISIAICFLYNSGYSQANTHFKYKQVDTTALFLDVKYPENFQLKKTVPAIIFFFGGGWNNGNIAQFEKQATYFAKRGLICILADYRVMSRQETTPFESLKDAKSAIRYIRIHARELGIDPNRIVGAGGSAGGHLAAAAALITGYNQNTDDLSISCVPNALVLFNPVIDNGPDGYGYERIGDQYKNFSPLHNIKKGAPPTIIFQGTKDKLIPVATAEKYKTNMEKVGSRCELRLYDGQVHGFFNYKNLEYYKKTLEEADKFLQSLGYLKQEPVIKVE